MRGIARRPRIGRRRTPKHIDSVEVCRMSTVNFQVTQE
jgi:hypothetical protein